MTTPSLSQRWYVPAEIAALRIWLPFAALVNLVVLGGEALRRDGESQLIVLAGTILLVLLRLYLPDGSRSFRRPASQLLAAAVLFIGGYSAIQGSHTLYDLWAATWLIIPAGCRPLLGVRGREWRLVGR